MSTTKAIILAAGRSSRLYPITLERPKCLLELGGKPIIQWQIEILRKIGISDIVVVVGYKKEVIMGQIGNTVRYRVYEDFDKTNNLHTLHHVKDELDQDCLILFSDVLIDLPLLKKINNVSEDFTLLVNSRQVRDDTIKVVLEEKLITRVGSHLTVEESNGNFLGISKVSKDGGSILASQLEKMRDSYHSDYFTLAIDQLTLKGQSVSSVELEYYTWIEIDTRYDLFKAHEQFNNINL